MNRLFGKSRAAAPVAQPTASAEPPPEATMHETKEIIEKREAHVRRLIDAEVDAARAHQSANRKKDALECIKRKRLHDKELERLSAQKMNIIQQEQMLQQLRVTSIVNGAMASGAAAMEREMRRVGGVDGVDALHDRLEDALADGNDLLDASARAMGEASNLDEAELLDELEALELEQDEEDERALKHALTGDVMSGERYAQLPPAPEPRKAILEQAAPVPAHDPRVAIRARKEREERLAEERELAELSAAMAVEQPAAASMAMKASDARFDWEGVTEITYAPRATMAREHPAMAVPMMQMAACY